MGIYALGYRLGSMHFACEIGQAEIDRPWSPWELIGAVELVSGVNELVREPGLIKTVMLTDYGPRTARDLMLGDGGAARVWNFWAGAARRDMAELLDLPTQPR